MGKGKRLRQQRKIAEKADTAPPKKSWHEQRAEWNEQQQCSREACRRSLKRIYGIHRDTDLHYCFDCVLLLRKYNGEEIIKEIVRNERV